MPVDFLYSAREIMRGDPKVVCGLLEQMKKSYKDHYSTR